MSDLFLKYYTNVAVFNLGFCFICPVVGVSLVGCVILFGTLGSMVSFGIYKYFQNKEYYFYANKGLTRNQLQFKSAIINLSISLFALLVLWAKR